MVKKIITIALLISFVIGAFSVLASAEEQDKLKRTSSNLALGWTAIPEAITKVTKDTDNPFLGITVGLFKGIANAFARTTSGVADVVTILDPKQEPVIKDEMVSLETSVSSKGSNISPSKTVKIK